MGPYYDSIVATVCRLEEAEPKAPACVLSGLARLLPWGLARLPVLAPTLARPRPAPLRALARLLTAL